jgi:hypothetical protein
VQVALPEAIALVERVVADLIYNKNPIHLRIRDGAVKVALAHGAVSGHDDPRPVHDHP